MKREPATVVALRLYPEDKRAIKEIMRRWGLTTKSAALRLALRVLSQARLEPVINPRTEVEDEPEQRQ